MSPDHQPVCASQDQLSQTPQNQIQPFIPTESGVVNEKTTFYHCICQIFPLNY